VVFIAIDDLNDWIACLGGHPQAITPNIDRLAGQGILFTNAHCAAPACKPSRAAIFSGRQAMQTGVYWNKSLDLVKSVPEEELLPAHFAASGYKTLGTGKLLHGGGTDLFQSNYKTEQRWSPFSKAQATYRPDELPSKGGPNPRHVIKAGPGGRDWILPMNRLPSERNPDKRGGESFDWGPTGETDAEMGDTRITNWAMARLDEPRKSPFFLAVGYYRPHIPLFAPQQDFDRYPAAEEILLPEVIADDLADVGPAAKRWALEANTAGTHQLVEESGQWREAVRAYLACVTFADRQVGRLLESLEKSPHADNTWIILWSDHGWHLGEKQHWGKWTGWRESTRVPLIIVPPRNDANAPRGETCHEAVGLIDLYPTLIDICKLQPRGGLAGTSLAPLLANPKQKTGRAVLTTFDEGNHAISTRDWRYIRYNNGEEELYQCANDPHEWKNLASSPEQAGQLEKMRNLLEETTRAAR